MTTKATKKTTTTKRAPTAPNALIEQLIRELGFETSEVRNVDSLDFRDCHVAAVRDALLAAYEAGRKG
jgi:hypothetical protein